MRWAREFIDCSFPLPWKCRQKTPRQLICKHKLCAPLRCRWLAVCLLSVTYFKLYNMTWDICVANVRLCIDVLVNKPTVVYGRTKRMSFLKISAKKTRWLKMDNKKLWPEKSYPRLNYYSQNDESCTNNQRLQAKCTSVHPHKKPWHRRRSKRSGAYM